MVIPNPRYEEQVENGECEAEETLEKAESEHVDAASSAHDSKAATSKVTAGYRQVIHDRFQKPRKNNSSSFKARVEDSVSGAASMLQSMFLGRAKHGIDESDNDKANRIIDELDAQFKPTLQSKIAAVDDQGQRQIDQRGWSWLKPW